MKDIKISELPEGIRLELELFDENGVIISPSFPSKLECLEEGILQVSAPMREGIIVPVHPGDKLNVYFFWKDNLYCLKSVVTDRSILKNGLPVLHIETQGEIRKVQRRKYFRFNYSLPVNYRIVDETERSREENSPFIPSITRNLSGGGLCLLLEEKIPLNQMLELELRLEDSHSILISGKTVRMDQLENCGKYCYEAGIVFRNLEYREKEAIIRFIFQEQRKLIKKGLI